MAKLTPVPALRLNATFAANPTKRKIVGMEPMLPTIHHSNVIFNKNKRQHRPTSYNHNCRGTKKLITPRLRFGETVDVKAYSIEDPPTEYSNNLTTNCDRTPTEVSLRRQAIATIKRHNANKEQQKEYPEWIRETDEQYMTTQTPLPESNQERSYDFDKDYRGHPWDRPDLYDQSSLSFKKQPIAPVSDQNEDAHNEKPTSEPPKDYTNGSNRKPTFPEDFPISLNSIKE